MDSSKNFARRKSTRYVAKVNSREYPPKLLISCAAKYAIGIELPSKDFSGGSEANNFLRKLGFVVLESRKKISIKHNDDRCKACKIKFLLMLKAAFGEAYSTAKRTIPTRLEEHLDSLHYPTLKKLLKKLENQRGRKKFSKKKNLAPCDFYLPKYDTIVEFDETQHFTQSRMLALKAYPAELQLGFNKERWIQLCKQLNAQDNSPEYRDEQRAWYDALRDLSGSRIVRVYSKDFRWCTLNPKLKKDISTFKKFVNLSVFKKKMKEVETFELARLVINGDWSGQASNCKKILFRACNQISAFQKARCLVTCGGFLRVESVDQIRASSPNISNMELQMVIKLKVENAARTFLTNSLLKRLRKHFEYISLGIDTYKSKISETTNYIKEDHAELIVLVNLKTLRCFTTGKIYPTSNQARHLIRYDDLQSHFVSVAGERILILGCHDLTIFSPRGNAKAGLERSAIIRKFRKIAKAFKPTIVLQHPHTTVKAKTWAQQWAEIRRDLPSVKTYTSAGSYSSEDSGWKTKSSLESCLRHTKLGEVLDIVVPVHF
ncbi:hypothetical protein KA183_13140 [bacterium]|nr:hypothetical protein [bacterium]